jgi:hypothetical protein
MWMAASLTLRVGIRGRVRCCPAGFFMRITSRRRGLDTDEFFFLLANGSLFLLIVLVGRVFVVGCPIFILD